MAPIYALDDELVAAVLGFAAPRELEAFACASKFAARVVLPRFPVWRALFCARWAAVNFALPGAGDGSVPVVLTPQLRALFPPSCSESRVFQVLTHALTPVPSFADINVTRYYRGRATPEQEIVSLHEPRVRAERVVDFAYDGEFLGDDRCVRSNVPFPAAFHVAVFKRKNARTQRLEYQVGIVSSGYFEVSITKRLKPEAIRINGEDVTSVGIVTGRFPLVDRQPGWDFRSYGYHGDNGHTYHSNRGQEFGPAFGTNDTVGCCVRRVVKDERSFVTFTHNGAKITTLAEDFECVHDEWYPAVGLDSTDAIHLNFGQEPFVNDSIVDEMLAESEGMKDIACRHLEWQHIHDFEDDEYDESDEDDEEEDEARSSEGEASSQGSDFYSDAYDEYGLIDYDSDSSMSSPSAGSNGEDDILGWTAYEL